MRDVLWRGKVGGTDVRIVKMAEDDCLVEEVVVPAKKGQVMPPVPPVPPELAHRFSLEEDGIWAACNDEVASRAYMAALLEADGILREVKDLGNAGCAGIPAARWRRT